MIFCTNCGKQLEDGSLFCDNCGTKLEVQPVQPEQPAQPQFEQPEQPVQPQPGQPVQPQPGQPVQTQPEQPAQPQPGQPVQTQPEQPAQPQFGQPAQPQFGQPVQPQFAQPVQPQFAQSGQPVPQPAFAGADAKAAKKPLNKKLIIIGAAAAAAVALIIVLLFIFLGGKGSQNYLYIKDGEINISNNGAKAWELTNYLYYSNVSGQCKISDDGSRIFYPDGGALYFKNPTDEKGEANMVASNVSEYEIDAGGNNVLYLTSGDDLYKYSVSADNKSKVGIDVRNYCASEDLSKIAFITDENSLYVKIGDNDKVKVDNDVTSWFVSDDYNTFVYLKENSVYKKIVSSDEKEKLASNVSALSNVYFDNGVKFYFTKENKITINYWDVVDDDLADSDSKMNEPVKPEYPEYPKRESYPDYPYSFNYDDEAEYKKAKEEYEKKKKEIDDAYNKAREEYDKAVEEYNKANDKYWDDYSAYNEKKSRDELRAKLKEKTSESVTYSLYFYNGTEEAKLCDNVSNAFNTGIDTAANEPVVIYNQLIGEGVAVKVKMSEISSVYDVENALSSSSVNADAETKMFVAAEAKASEVAINDIADYLLSDDGTTLYYTIADSDNIESSDLYKATVSDGAISGETKIDTDLYSFFFLNFDGKFLYAKEFDMDNGTMDLYYDGTLIDDDISIKGGIGYQDGTYYYFTDYDSNSSKATLMCKKADSDPVKIKDDVSEYCICSDGSVMYMYDYSNSSSRGELYLYRNGNSEKLDDDVTRIIPLENKNAPINCYYKLP